VSRLQATFAVSERRACQAIDQARSSQRYQRIISDQEKSIVKRMHELVREHPRYGYRRIWALLRRDGWRINRKRVHRLWRAESLRVPQKQRKRRRLGGSGNSIVKHRSLHKDHVWCWDFIHDRDERGRPLKWLSIVDEFTRECLALEVGRSITSQDVIDVLRDLFLIRGAPRHIRSDNGPEFIAKSLEEYLARVDASVKPIAPGSPWENGYAESFHGRLRDELLNAEAFADMTHAKVLADRWRSDYNHRRPHSSLKYMTPAEFAASRGAAATNFRGHADPPVGAAPLPPAQRAVHCSPDPTLIMAGT
jgi:putative transposase